MLHNTPEIEEQQNQNNAVPQQQYSRFWRLLNIILAMAGSISLSVLLTFFTFFSKIAAAIPYLAVLPIASTMLEFLYKFPKFLNKPIDWKIKLPIGLLILASTLSSTLALASGVFAHFFPIFIKVAYYAPVLFVISMGIGTCLSAFGFIQEAYSYITKPRTHTPLTTLRLVNKGIKTALLATMTAAVIPLFMALGTAAIFIGLTNPFTAGPVAAILFSIIIAASVTLVALKIAKTIVQHRLQEKAAEKALAWDKSPYELLDIKENELKNLSNKEILIMVNEKFSIKEAQLGSPKNNSLHARQLYEAYELLQNPRSRDLYHMFKLIKNRANSDNPIEEPETTLKIKYGFLKYRPFSWLNYQYQKLKADNENTKQNLDIAYRIISNNALYQYFKNPSSKVDSGRHISANDSSYGQPAEDGENEKEDTLRKMHSESNSELDSDSEDENGKGKTRVASDNEEGEISTDFEKEYNVAGLFRRSHASGHQAPANNAPIFNRVAAINHDH